MPTTTPTANAAETATTTEALPAPVNAATRVLTAVLAPLSTPATTPAAQAAQAPVLWGVMAWVRRTFSNSSPTLAQDPTHTSQLDDTITGRVITNDADADTLTLTASTPVNGGTVVVHPDGTFTYTVPTTMYATGGTDAFTITATDAGAPAHIHGLSGFLNAISFGKLGSPGHTATTNITLTIAPVNAAPIPGTPAYTLAAPDHTLGTIEGALHVTDPDLDTLHYTVTGGPTDGAVTLRTDGTFTYTPTPTARHQAAAENATPYQLADDFSVTVDDGHGGVINVPVSVTVDPTNAPPTMTVFASDPDSAGTVHISITVTDPDTDPVTYLVLHDPAYGTLVPTVGGYDYTPTAEARHAAAATEGVDTDTLTVTASDLHHGVDTENVAVTISPANIAPVAVDDTVTTAEDTPVTIPAPGVLANDTDADNDIVTVADYTQPAHGSVVVNDDGSFTYTPETDFYGADNFTYTATDNLGAASNTALVNVTVTAVNDAPIAADDTVSTPEDTPITVAAPGVLGNDTDVDGKPLTVTDYTQPTHGSVVVDIDGSFTYTPSADYAGDDTFTYTATDPSGATDTATVNVTVTAVNDVPVTHADAYTTVEDTALVITATAGVLANDTDVEGGPLTVTDYTQPAHGSVVINTDGSFTYTPTANFAGDDTFTYTASDGTATDIAIVVVRVNPVNDAPVATNNTYTANEDTPLTVDAPGVLGNDTDAEGTPLTAALVDNATHGTVVLNANGSFTYTPANNYNGPDSFTYTASDGAVTSNVATVTLNVTAVNDLPVAVNDAYATNEDTALQIPAPGVLGNDTDAEGGPLYARLGTPPAHGTVALNANGSFTYTPATDYNGPDSFTYITANDLSFAAVSNTATVAITVTPVNDVPVAHADAYTTAEDTALVVTATAGMLANDTDVEGGPLTVTDYTQPAHGTVTVNTDGSFTYTPTTNYNGPDTFTYTASDAQGGTSNPTTVALAVVAVNDAPVTNPDTYTTAEDSALVVAGAAGVLANDTDVEGGPLTVTGYTQPGHGTVTVNTDGSFTYTPAANYNGPDTFSYTATDPSGATDTATVALTITPVNDAPVPADPASTIAGVNPTTGQVGGNLHVTDPDGDVLSYSAPPTTAKGGTVMVAPTGFFTYTPTDEARHAASADDAHSTGADQDSFTVTVSDGRGGTVTVPVTVDISPTNKAPIPTAPPTVGNPTSYGAVMGSLGVADQDGDQLAYALVSAPTSGRVAIDPATGNYVYTPYDNARLHADTTTGPDTDSFAVTVTDGHGGSTTITVPAVPVSAAEVVSIGTVAVDSQPSGVAVNRDATRAYVVNQSSNTVSVIDTAGNNVVNTIGVGDHPIGVAVAPNGTRAYVANNGSGTVSVINTTTNAVIATVTVDSSPTGVAVSPDSAHVYVTNSGSNTVSVIDTATNAVVGTVAVDSTPYGVTVSPDGTHAYVTNRGSSSVSVIDTSTNTVTATVAVGNGPIGVAVSPDGSHVYVTNNGNNSVSVIDTSTNTVTGTVSGINDPRDVAFSKDGTLAYVASRSGNSVSVIDTATNTVVGTVPVGSGPLAMAVGSKGTAYVTNSGSSSVSLITLNAAPVASATVGSANLTTGVVTVTVSASDPASEALTVTTTAPSQGHVVVVDNGGGTWTLTYTPTDGDRLNAGVTPGDQTDSFTVTVTDSRGVNSVVPVAVPVSPTKVWPTASIPVGTHPIEVAVTPDGTRTYIVNNQVSGTVSVIDNATNTVIKSIAVGGYPGAVAVSQDGSRAYVTSGYDGSVSVINTATNTVIDTITVSGSPAGVAVSPDGTRLYVTSTNTNSLIVIDTATKAVIKTIPVGNVPLDVTVNGNGTRAYVANLNSNTVTVIDAVNNVSLGTVNVGTAPSALALSPDGARLYVTNRGSNSVSVINTATGAVSAIPVGSTPRSVAVSPDGSLVYVGNSDGSMSVIHTATNTVISTVPVVASGLAFGSHGTAYATNYDGNAVTVVSLVHADNVAPTGSATVGSTDPVTGDVTVTLTASDADGDPLTVTTSTPSQGRVNAVDNGNGTWTLTYNPTDAARLHAGQTPGVDNDSFTINLSDGLGGYTSLPVTAVSVSPAEARVTDTVGVGNSPWGVAVSPDGTRAYVTNQYSGSLSVINTATGDLITALNVGSTPMGVAVTPDGTRVYVTNQGSSSVSAINTATNTVTTNTIGTAQYPTAIAISPNGKEAYVITGTSVNIINTDPGSPNYNQTIYTIYGIGTAPRGVAFTPDGTQAYVANAGSNSVSVINTATRTVTKTISVGIGPVGVAVSPDGTRAYVVNNTGMTVSVINTATNTVTTTVPLGSGGNANGIAVSRDGTLIYVTRGASVSVMDAATNTVIATLPVGNAPTGVAVGSDGTAYVANAASNTVSVISLATKTGV